MSFFEQYRTGNLVLPNALFFHFKDIFPSADDFLVWQFLYLQTTTQIGEVASSQIAQATGKTLTEVNKSITTLTEAGLLDFTTIQVNNEIEMVVDASPALAVLDKLVSSEKPTTGPVVGQPTNTQLIKQLTDELEQALGILNPMVIEDLNKEIQEEHTDPELIREALKEAVFNRKTNWNYIKGVLRNWKISGITTKIQVEERRLEHQGKKQHHQVSDEFKTGMDAATTTRSRSMRRPRPSRSTATSSLRATGSPSMVLPATSTASRLQPWPLPIFNKNNCWTWIAVIITCHNIAISTS